MMSFLLAFVVAQIGCVCVELLTSPRSPFVARSLPALLLRVAVFGFVFVFFFAMSWRPGFAAGATMIFTGVFVAISRAKMAFIHEPLVFADLAFIADVFRHPKLFYTTFLGPLFMLAAIGSIAAAITVWFYFEPHILPETGSYAAILAVAVAWVLLALSPFLPFLRRLWERCALAIKDVPEAHADVAADGQLVSLAGDFLAWRGDDRARRTGRWEPPLPVPLVWAEGVTPAQLIVVAQCESFFDFRRLDGQPLALPSLDAARERAVAWGTLATPIAGGYTMRSEFALLTGRKPQDIGFDRYYPYLNSAAYGRQTLPSALRETGYQTVFLHPYYADFFWRHRGLPAIGFDRLVMIEDFDGASKVGDYVADLAVAERIVSQARAASGPQFLFAATMENHGPWEAGRFAGLTDPVAIFKRHLTNGDAMLGYLMKAFEAWPGRVALLFYGDHVPLLKAYADPFPDPRTDYVLLELGSAASRRSPQPAQPRAVHELTWELLSLAGLRGEPSGNGRV
jgi:phosphoglycerol transferase MdoB-like AlkP superfamily enzyme